MILLSLLGGFFLGTAFYLWSRLLRGETTDVARSTMLFAIGLLVVAHVAGWIQ